jgi:two-component system chemotaxis response regulator CheY
MTKTCLIADDDPVSREILRLYMEENGYKVSVVANGDEALLLCRAKHFDCVFVDWEMPVKNGIEFIQSYSKQSSELPIFIMCSTHDKSRELELARDIGVREYIIKPVKRKELDVKLKNIGII